jgi:outer membrane immunogenic protein
MKKVLLAGIAGIVLVTGSAHAADLSRQPVYKAPLPAMAPAFSWTGCYIGGNVGGAWGRTTASAPGLAPGISLTGDTSGVIGGGQVVAIINSHPIG